MLRNHVVITTPPDLCLSYLHPPYCAMSYLCTTTVLPYVNCHFAKRINVWNEAGMSVLRVCECACMCVNMHRVRVCLHEYASIYVWMCVRVNVHTGCVFMSTCMCVCVCVHVWICILCVCVWICMYVHVCECMCTCINMHIVHAWICVHVCMLVDMCVCVCVKVHGHTCAHACMHACVCEWVCVKVWDVSIFLCGSATNPQNPAKHDQLVEIWSKFNAWFMLIQNLSYPRQVTKITITFYHKMRTSEHFNVVKQ